MTRRRVLFGLRVPRTPNATNALVFVGVAVLGLSFYIPYWTAARVARAEGRALDSGQQLLALALETEPDLTDPQARIGLFNQFAEWTRETGLPESWWPERIVLRAPPGEPVPPGLTIRMKHYYLRLSRTPRDRLARLPEADQPTTVEPPGDEAAPGEGTDGGARPWPGDEPPPSERIDEEVEEPRREPFEVHAWPAGNLGAGYTAFYLPESGQRAYTRNKAAKYKGDERVPLPGDGQPRQLETDAEPAEHIGWYRSQNDERWILMPDEPSGD